MLEQSSLASLSSIPPAQVPIDLGCAVDRSPALDNRANGIIVLDESAAPLFSSFLLFAVMGALGGVGGRYLKFLIAYRISCPWFDHRVRPRVNLRQSDSVASLGCGCGLAML